MDSGRVERAGDWVMKQVVRPCAVAVFFVYVALLWTWTLKPFIPYPFVFFFFGAVMGSAWFGGTLSGFLSVILSTLIIVYFFVPPLYSFAISSESIVYFLAYVACAVAASWVSSAKKRSERAIMEARDQLEERVKERTAELEKTNSELKESEERLQELTAIARMLSMSEVSASIAHEINQPLTAIVTHSHALAGWLRAQPPNVTMAMATSDKIAQEGRRAGAIVARVRALFRKQEADRQPVSLNTLVTETLRLLREESQRRGVLFRAELSTELPEVEIDRTQMQQVIVNLVVNGMDAMREDKGVPRELLVATVLNGSGAVQVSVLDRGTGVSKEMAQRIFDPFFSTKQEGLGVGLSISRSIVEAHDGRLWVEARAGGGSIFRFTIPVKEAQ